jgi:hypothetical protein
MSHQSSSVIISHHQSSTVNRSSVIGHQSSVFHVVGRLPVGSGPGFAFAFGASKPGCDLDERRRRARTGMTSDLEELLKDLLLPSRGTGPLLQRDYWGVIENCRMTPREVADLVAREFPRFAPEELVRFERVGEVEGPLAVGDELEVSIRLVGRCRVRVVHRDANSITLGTLEGHPEAGRITFGAYRDEGGQVIFHIRSRARSASGIRYAAYVAAGEAMQTTTWTDFIDRVAHSVGDGVAGVIHAEKKVIEDEGEDPETICSPTFLASGD